jgi:hypothetical protein
VNFSPQEHALRTLRDDAQGGWRRGIHQLRVRA